MKQEKPYTLKLNTFTAEVTRKQMKTIRLRVLPDGQVRLSAPAFLPKEEIKRFLLERQEWVETQLRRLAEQSAQQENAILSGDSLTVFGASYPLHLTEAPRFSMTIDNDEALLACPGSSTAEQRQHFLESWYRALLKKAIRDRLPLWEEKTGLRSTGFQIRDMTSRWGSCTVKTGKLRFNLQLVKYPLPCLDYVMLHELCHLAVPNHGKDFKALLFRYMPDWQERKKLLRGQ